jgi:undecaprenyl-diphosphatase
MTILQAVILGIIEGLTEFLPVSSTAHLVLSADLMKLTGSEFLKSFEIIIQLGAILSVVVLYWKRFLNLEIIKKLVVAFIPTGVIGLTVYKAIKAMLGSVNVVLIALILGGVVLILFKRFHEDVADDPDMKEITYRRAFMIGLFQALAVVPGVSRSAATIIGGSLIGVSKRTIVEFSFLLAVPTMAAASGLELLKGYSALSENVLALAVGFVVSFITAIVAIKSFLAFVKSRSFAAFGWYRIVVAVAYFFVVALRS